MSYTRGTWKNKKKEKLDPYQLCKCGHTRVNHKDMKGECWCGCKSFKLDTFSGVPKRYEIKVGKFGAYFYDSEQERDVDLNEALDILNKWDKLMNLGEKLGGPKR